MPQLGEGVHPEPKEVSEFKAATVYQTQHSANTKGTYRV